VAVAGPFELHAGTSLYLNDGLANAGVMTVNPAGANSNTIIRVNESLAVGGGGEVVLNADPGNLDSAHLTGVSAGAVLTNLEDHTISGCGNVFSSLVNQGVVVADKPGRVLQLHHWNKSNQELIAAVDGGVLRVANIDLAQSGSGRLRADGGALQFSSMSLLGGWIEAANAGSASVIGGACTFNDVTIKDVLTVNAGTSLYIGGAGMTNDGTVTVNHAGANLGTLVRMNTSGTVGGGGEFVLNADPGNLDSSHITGVSAGAVLTNAATHTIRGVGNIYATVVNNGVIDADRSGVLLQLHHWDKVNNGTIRATNNGIARVSNITVTQGAAGRIFAADGAAEFSSAGVAGGTVEAAPGEIARTVGGSSTFSAVTTKGAFDLNAGTSLNVADGLVNEGVVRINHAAANAATNIRFNNAGAFTGAGTLVLNANSGNFDSAYISGVSNGIVKTNGPSHTITGIGRIYGNFANAGTLAPGLPIGRLEVLNGSFTQAAGGTLQSALGGKAPSSEYDVLACGGDANLGGTLELSWANGYVATLGDKFDIVTANSVNGAFGTVVFPASPTGFPARIHYLPKAVRVSMCYADSDGDGVLSIDDFITYQTEFAFGLPSADCDQDGMLSIDDFICFQTGFAIGCP
jgi:hypothetical protein